MVFLLEQGWGVGCKAGKSQVARSATPFPDWPKRRFPGVFLVGVFLVGVLLSSRF